MKLYLIRHGSPDYANDTITDEGHREASLLAEKLKNFGFDRIVVSPLGRAQHTAEYLGKSNSQDLITLNFLSELAGNYKDDLYAWGMHGTEVFAEHDEMTVAKWPERVEYGDHMKKVFAEFTGSLDEFLSEFGLTREGPLYKVDESDYKEHKEKKVAVVCHAGVIMTALSHFLNVPLPIIYSQFWIDPSSLTTLKLEYKNGKGLFRMTSMNDMGHVHGAGSSDTSKVAQT